ncbi:MAG: hypothetical protein R3Y68_08965 [Rikenellaceae bacterium]
MKKTDKILWLINGKIKDFDGFNGVVADVVEMARSEHATKTYWWSVSQDRTRFCDLDIYDNEQAALEHIEHWTPHSDEFSKYAANERLLVLGDVPHSINDALSAMNPHYMGYFGGFAKDKPTDADPLSEVIWSLEGRVTDKAMFREACDKLTPITQAENGSILYLWCVDEEDRFFVLERYLDSDAAMTHMKNTAEGGKLFFGSTEVTAFTIYSEISPELADVVKGLNPERMEFAAGFAR